MLPIGDWSDASGVGFGALIRAEKALDAQLSVTGRVGYIYHLSKSVSLLGSGRSPLPGFIALREGWPGLPP